MTGTFPAAIIGLGAGGGGPDSIMGVRGGGGGPDSIMGLGTVFIMTVVTGAPESMTLGGIGVFMRVSRPTPMRALSTGRGDGSTVGPLL